MKPPPFDYVRPSSLPEALQALANDDGALPLAGGQSLVPMLNMRLARPTTVVDLVDVPDLGAIVASGDTIRIGALTTHRALGTHPLLAGITALPRAVAEIGFQAIRNRGTLGGSLAHGDPAAELPALMLALDARVTLTSSSGAREVDMDDFAVGYYTTIRKPSELITAIEIDTPPELRTGFAEISRRHGDFAIALAAVATWNNSGSRQARVVVGGLDVRPRRIPQIEAALANGSVNDALAVATPSTLESMTSPSSDIHGSASYRLAVGAEMVRRSLNQMEVAN